MVELFGDLGGDASWTGPNELLVNAAGASKFAPDIGLCSKMRAAFLLARPLLSRFGRAPMPPPGGAVIGRRALDPHVPAFHDLGAAIDHRHGPRVSARRPAR